MMYFRLERGKKQNFIINNKLWEGSVFHLIYIEGKIMNVF